MRFFATKIKHSSSEFKFPRMKKISLLICLFSAFILSGCFEIIQETTINDNETGVVKNTTDLSTMIGMAKMMGGAEDLDKMGEAKDTTISLAKLADSLATLTDQEKALVKRGSLNLNMNIKDEKFLVTFIFPYSDPKDVSAIPALLKKIRKEVVGGQMDAIAGEGDEAKKLGEGVSETTEIEEFFDVSQSKGVLTRTLNKERYAKVNDDEGLKSLKEMSAMGSPMTVKTIINLPRPAKNITAKGAEVSADKKKITISSTIDDLFDDPSKFEYRIEY